MNSLCLAVDHSFSGYRLDKFLAETLSDMTRSRIQKLIEDGFVLKNGIIISSTSTKVKTDDHISITIPEPEEAIPQPEDIPITILYEDTDLLVINKPAGLVVHPAPGHAGQTLVNALLFHCHKSLSGIGGVKRPGIVHRLDKDTSGLMVVAKNDSAHQGLSAQFSDRSLSRTYYAFVWGIPSPSRGIIETLIGRSPTNRQKMAVVSKNGKPAITHYQILEIYLTSTPLSLIECTLQTGRTHQIRVHMKHINHPLIGDPLYGTTNQSRSREVPAEIRHFPRQALHAKRLQFIHPRTEKALSFDSSLPSDLEELHSLLKKKNF
jgi:23S rRNA pseudouridine1911/1915/1917 synthase